jgi:hypothetical protein
MGTSDRRCDRARGPAGIAFAGEIGDICAAVANLAGRSWDVLVTDD